MSERRAAASSDAETPTKNISSKNEPETNPHLKKKTNKQPQILSVKKTESASPHFFSLGCSAHSCIVTIAGSTDGGFLQHMQLWNASCETFNC